MSFLVTCAFMEIYNEALYDLRCGGVNTDTHAPAWQCPQF